MTVFDIREYQTADGRRPFAQWFKALRNRQAVRAIAARLTRIRAGNRGDWRPVGEGVFELRIDVGTGYRVYCGRDGKALVLLLCGGDKRTQSKDIERAHDYWKDYKTRCQHSV